MSRVSRPASVIALRANVAAWVLLPVCSSSSPSSSHSAGLFGSSRKARSSEARAAGTLPAARCARLCSSSAPLAPLASLCGRAAGTSPRGSGIGSERGGVCVVGGNGVGAGAPGVSAVGRCRRRPRRIGRCGARRCDA